MAWFRKGAALATASHDLDPGRREGLLLGALLLHPAWLEVLAEDLAALPLTGSERERLRTALLEAAAEVDHPDPKEDVAALEAAAIARHLNTTGLTGMAEALRQEAIRGFGPAEPDTAARDRWRREAESHRLAFGEVSSCGPRRQVMRATPARPTGSACRPCWNNPSVAPARAAAAPRPDACPAGAGTVFRWPHGDAVSIR